jgi:hypothetical protein
MFADKFHQISLKTNLRLKENYFLHLYLLKITVCWDVMLCHLAESNQCSAGTCCHHLHGRKVSHTGKWWYNYRLPADPLIVPLQKNFFLATVPPQNIFSLCFSLKMFFPAFLRATISHRPTHIPVSFYHSFISGPSFSLATYSLITKIKTASISEMSVPFYQNTQHYIPEDRSHHSHCLENLKLYILCFVHESTACVPILHTSVLKKDKNNMSLKYKGYLKSTETGNAIHLLWPSSK